MTSSVFGVLSMDGSQTLRYQNFSLTADSSGFDKTCNQFLIHFFAISRRNHLKWLSSYINHISGYVITSKETRSCPLFPDSYAFS